MRYEQVISELCVLVADVGSRQFKSTLAYDCFCSSTCKARVVVDDRIIAFINDAVDTKIRDAEFNSR
jgi:hypothetical protein